MAETEEQPGRREADREKNDEQSWAPHEGASKKLTENGYFGAIVFSESHAMICISHELLHQSELIF